MISSSNYFRKQVRYVNKIPLRSWIVQPWSLFYTVKKMSNLCVAHDISQGNFDLFFSLLLLLHMHTKHSFTESNTLLHISMNLHIPLPWISCSLLSAKRCFILQGSPRMNISFPIKPSLAQPLPPFFSSVSNLVSPKKTFYMAFS